ncbi:MAG: YhjD/YihY/BrkB family envelope integrity protein [Acidimicrobiales bacterium]
MTDEQIDEESVERTRTRLEELRSGASGFGSRIVDRLSDLRSRSAAVDVGVRIYERDKEAAGTLLGSALALRFFLFLVPMMLFAVGVAGLLGIHAGVDSAGSALGITGLVGDEIDEAFSQTGRSSWIALILGLYFMAWAGRSLARALLLSSALGWGMGGNQRTPFRLVGVVVGVITGTAFVWAVLNRIRLAAGVALASVSFVAVAGAYVLLWVLLFLALPRSTTDPGAALPGASLVAITLTGLQAISMLYVPGALDSSSSVYGAIGLAVTLLGWFFIIGRTLAFAFAMNAVIYEQIGSVSQVVFELPGLRVLPRRFSGIARFFDLDVPTQTDG